MLLTSRKILLLSKTVGAIIVFDTGMRMPSSVNVIRLSMIRNGEKRNIFHPTNNTVFNTLCSLSVYIWYVATVRLVKRPHNNSKICAYMMYVTSQFGEQQIKWSLHWDKEMGENTNSMRCMAFCILKR